MNIFFLHRVRRKSAQLYVNKHVVKLSLEIAQMLYTAQHECEKENESWKEKHRNELGCEPYKLAHKNHPTTKWVRQHEENYIYTCKLGLELCREYTRRYKKVHKCQAKIEWLLNNVPKCDHDIVIDAYLATESIPPRCTPVPLAMPKEYHQPDLIKAYNAYYIGAKSHLFDK
jgi:hypothetical protein